jgi:hypothetical protein
MQTVIGRSESEEFNWGFLFLPLDQMPHNHSGIAVELRNAYVIKRCQNVANLTTLLAIWDVDVRLTLHFNINHGENETLWIALKA